MALTGCDSDNGSPPAQAGADASGADTAADSAGGIAPVALHFEATVNGVAAKCGMDYSDLGSSKVTGQLADARVFLSNIQLKNSAGEWVALSLDASDWQGSGVALLDFEDASGGCKDTGTPETNSMVTGSVPAGQYSAVRFDVGVPFALNHTDNSLSNAPLSTPGMFWTWQAGYKFVRVDWKLASGKRWNLHVGSTGCTSGSSVEAPKSACAKVNLANAELPLASASHAMFAIDLGKLLAGVDVSADTASTAPGCMSGSTEPNDCSGSWNALGMAFETGNCTNNCSGQQVWSVP